MSKAIMISIKPKWVAKILNGKKTIEIRKTIPKYGLPVDVYIYCTKDKETIAINPYGGYAVVPNKYKNEYFNGKVVAKFTLNSVLKCELINDSKFDSFFHRDYQLTRKELKDYVGENAYYEWHISNLVIFDKPKELSKFYSYCKDEKCEYRNNHCSICYRTPLTKAPQSWCYVDVE